MSYVNYIQGQLDALALSIKHLFVLDLFDVVAVFMLLARVSHGQLGDPTFQRHR